MANLKEQEKWEDGVYQIEENDPVLGGENGITNKPIKQLANRTLWLKKFLELFGKKSAPKDLTANSTSTADESGHSHKLPVGSTTEKGIWQATSDTGVDSDGLVLTAKAGKKLAQLIATVQLALNNYIPLKSRSSSVTSNDENGVATPKAVKTAYDKGVEAKNAADAANTNANSRIQQRVGNCEFTTQADGNFVVKQGGKVKYHLLGIVDTLLGKLNKNGDTMTGNLAIRNGSDWSQVNLYNALDKELRIESLPDSEDNYMKCSYRSTNGEQEYFFALLPKRSGVIAFLNDIKNVIRKDYTKTIKGTRADWDNGTSKSISVTGYTEVYPDGRIVQLFYLQNFRLSWFALEKAVNDSVRIPEMSIELWTAMPNKITWAEAHISRTEGSGVTVSLTAGAEASEWIKPIWAFEKQPGAKNKVSLYLRRWFGGADEAVDMMIKVEGY